LDIDLQYWYFHAEPAVVDRLESCIDVIRPTLRMGSIPVRLDYF